MVAAEDAGRRDGRSSGTQRRLAGRANRARSPTREPSSRVREIGRHAPSLDHTNKGEPGVALDWFNMLCQALLGEEKGPRFGSFVAVYGLANPVAMIDGALARAARPRVRP